MNTIAILNQKGGVGKTTTAVNIGACLAQMQKRVLLIDLDPQANLTYSLGVLAHELEYSIYDVLKGTISLDDVILKKSHVDLVPANLSLSGAEIEFTTRSGGGTNFILIGDDDLFTSFSGFSSIESPVSFVLTMR